MLTMKKNSINSKSREEPMVWISFVFKFYLLESNLRGQIKFTKNFHSETKSLARILQYSRDIIVERDQVFFFQFFKKILRMI